VADESLGRMARFNQYIVDTRGELRKVVWPTREQAVNLTVAVLFVTLLMTIILGGIDFIFAQVLQWLLSVTGP
jgi:preprotein translocase subunit SecE